MREGGEGWRLRGRDEGYRDKRRRMEQGERERETNEGGIDEGGKVDKRERGGEEGTV
jgi:hypothetical protein